MDMIDVDDVEICKRRGCSAYGKQAKYARYEGTIPNRDIFYYTQLLRPFGNATNRPEKFVGPYLAKQLPGLLKEHEYGLNQINKIFAAQWVSDRQVVFGTKCNKLIVMDLVTTQMARIPMLQSGLDSSVNDCPCGIHSIAVNPSRTLLATGAENVNNMAIYRLPTFDPVCIGECGHTDWIFDLQWLDDQFVVTGSRDSYMCLWRVRDDDDDGQEYLNPSSSVTPRRPSSTAAIDDDILVPTYRHMIPLCQKQCIKAEKVRALAYNDHKQELAALSLNAYVHLWDASTFTQKSSRKLRHNRENVCMAVSKCRNLYAIGSQSYVTIIDERKPTEPLMIASKQRGSGVRSVNFLENMLTIGTGAASIYFYDLRAAKFLELDCSHVCQLNIGKGWLRHDETYRDFFAEGDYPNAVYVHCFDESGTKLFTAGGPLPAGLWGNYAGLWQ